MEVLNRGLITVEQAARIFNRWHGRSVPEVESALDATSDQWEVMYKDTVRNVCQIDRCNEIMPDIKPECCEAASNTAFIRSFSEATVAQAIGDEYVENVFWSVYEDLLRKRERRGYLCADYAIHRIVLKRR